MFTVKESVRHGGDLAARVSRSTVAGVVGGIVGGLLAPLALYVVVWAHLAAVPSLEMSRQVGGSVVMLVVTYLLTVPIGIAVGSVAGAVFGASVGFLPRPIVGAQWVGVMLAGAVMGTCCVACFVAVLIGGARGEPGLWIWFAAVGALPGLLAASVTVRLSDGGARERSVTR